MKKQKRTHSTESNTVRMPSQLKRPRSRIGWAFVAVFCIFAFICMLGIASAAQNNKPLTLAQKEQRIQKLIDAGRAHLRPKPTPQTPPPQAAPTLQAGIADMHQGPFGSLFGVENFWQGPVGSKWELVYAGGKKSPEGKIGPEL